MPEQCSDFITFFEDQIPPHTFPSRGQSNDPLGPVSCTSYAAAAVGRQSTCGKRDIRGRQVRSMVRNPDGTRDVTGGTNLNQNDAALRAATGIDLSVRYHYPMDEVERRVGEGQPAVLQVRYEPIRRSRFRGSETFDDGHAIALLPVPTGRPKDGPIVMDALCDRRRPGLYLYQGESYPWSLLKEAAGELVLGQGRTGPLTVGHGWAYVAFGPDVRPQEYRVGFTPGVITLYRIVTRAGVQYAQRLPRNRRIRNPGSARVTGQPIRRPLIGDIGPSQAEGRPIKTVPLVHIADSALRGLWVAVNQPHASFREVN